MSIAFEQVSFSYTPLTKRQKKAGEVQRYSLRNVSFTLNDGEFLAIAGHTGSGKSTLVQHLNGLAEHFLRPGRRSVLSAMDHLH